MKSMRGRNTVARGNSNFNRPTPGRNVQQSYRQTNRRLVETDNCDTSPIEWTSGCGETVDLGCNPTEAMIFAALDISKVTATTTCTVNGGYVQIVGDSDIHVAKNGCLTTATRVFTATDACGNKSTCIRYASYREDKDGPTITITASPADGYLGCNPTEAQILAALGSATYSDACECVERTASFTDGPTESNSCGRSRTRTWTATDGCGNPSSASRTVYWSSDNTPPIIVATGTPSNGQLGCNPTQAEIEAALGTAQVSDDCGQVELMVSTSAVQANNCLKSQTRTWTATDDCGNVATPVTRTVYWKDDTTGPVIECLPSKEVDCSTAVVFDQPQISDACGGNVTLTYTDTVITTYCRTWTATDDCGNSSTCKQCITVNPCAAKGCTIGFWKNTPEIWDSPSDPISATAGFTKNTNLWTFLGIAAPTGFSVSLTMLQALNLGGGGCNNLVRQGVAALLSSAAFGASYPYPAPATNFTTLKNLIASKLLSGDCSSLASQLDTANNNESGDVCGQLKTLVSSGRPNATPNSRRAPTGRIPFNRFK